MDQVLKTLKEDYCLRASLLRKHLNVQDELEDEIADLEQSLITSKIIPELQQFAAMLLQDLECEVNLIVRKDANGNVIICDEDGCALEAMPDSTPALSTILITPSNIQDVQGRDIRITVNGRSIQEKNAIQTFIEALKQIGLDNVAKVGIMCSGYNLVDTKQRIDGSRRWQQQEGDKWIYVYFSNVTKVLYLMRIAEKLKLDIKIEAI